MSESDENPAAVGQLVLLQAKVKFGAAEKDIEKESNVAAIEPNEIREREGMFGMGKKGFVAKRPRILARHASVW